ncbi:MAG TPA: subclass B3 metallo-beta-lactamase [Rhizomicrobium sp.]|jgi:metallo-beta-lactamase class B|nr:subclass B3 metallo-beta-lactamase [Rhizomicrobium sp.]
MLRKFAIVAALSLLAMPASLAQSAKKPAAANKYLEPFPAYHIAGNIYYVGTVGQANYLITTPQGNILINSGVAGDVPLIKNSIAKLGFKYSDTKILLISHAHFDHDAGSAQVVKETGAKYDVMDSDVPVVQSGGKEDFNYGDKGGENLYPPVKVDRVLHDGDTVSLGGTVLTAHKTPGHTKGCTTWTMKVNDGGKSLNVVIVGSPNVNPGYVLVGNNKYPGIVQDYEKTFQVLKSLPVDLFLGAHGDYFGMEAKYAKLKAGGPNPFIDPDGYKAYIADREAAFRKTLAAQQAGGKP